VGLLLRKHGLQPKTILDLGTGTGEVIRECNAEDMAKNIPSTSPRRQSNICKPIQPASTRASATSPPRNFG